MSYKSNASIFNIMERFIRTVREMEDTILIPSRLLDLTVGDSQDRLQLEGIRGSIVKATIDNTDLYRLYSMISQMKIEILWSQDHMNTFQDENEDSEPTERFKYIKSSSSMQSICTSSNSESNITIENYSETDDEDAVSHAVRSFKRHLRGLYHNIEKMTLAAEYLTLRYQNDIDA
ncbi:PREDICTED: uncharacterized protein LOC108552620 isoform X2 [Eufriesea mexicana]|uniref:uncharacterized protein LOC108552620 isoform X2 n=1 Tax=Eufriesea mexicana TaxID=516756 RepID=UPI00083C03ED|nr:PREDICTED: uncharacterized protein LOC108552620 isoform X2 [Eufriesea mexicana]